MVRRAAAVLEEEVAAGIAGTQTIERRFSKERRIDQGEFEEVMGRFRKDAHELIDLAGDRIAELGAGDVQELAGRFTRDAHDVLDMALNLANLTPDIANRLAARVEAPDRARGTAPDEAR